MHVVAPQHSGPAAAGVSSPAAGAAAPREQQTFAAMTETEKRVVRPLSTSDSYSERTSNSFWSWFSQRPQRAKKTQRAHLAQHWGKGFKKKQKKNSNRVYKMLERFKLLP